LALIVTIGAYPAPSVYGYGVINAGNDAPLVQGALRAQGFADADILLLADEAATREGIEAAFRRHLIDGAQPGDVVVFHYSGHGHQITDDSGDELDGYDEVLVPFGAPNHDAIELPPGYAGERHLRDDLLDALLTELRRKLGPTGHLLVTIDACFSGSATRGSSGLPLRGDATPIGPPAVRRGGSATLLESRAGDDDDLAPLVVISATDFDQLDQEVWGPDRQVVGPLSLAIARTLPSVRPGMSYEAWFAQLRLAMADLVPSQTPQLEGAAGSAVLGGTATDQGRFVRVRDLVDDSIAVIEGGTLSGIGVGSRVRFFALDALPDDPAIEVGVVIDADELAADVLLARPDTAGRIVASRAVVSERSFGALNVAVAIEGSVAPAISSLLVEAIDTIPNLALVEGPADLALEATGDGRHILHAAVDGMALGTPLRLDNEADREVMIARLRAWGRNRFLAQLEMRDPTIDVRLEVVPVTHQITRRGCVASDTSRYAAVRTPAGWQFRPGDGYLLRLRNVGRDPAYVAVLEFAGTDVNQLFPNAALRVSDNRLAPGRSYLIEDLCFAADAPFGDYILKLFATRERLDFGPIVAAAGRVRSGTSLGYLEQLMADAYRGTRGGVTGRAAGTGSTDAVLIRVVEP
jgi:hypothetical protein